METFKAIILNIIYPGTGYLYLRDPDRKTIAKFLVLIWTLFIGALIYEVTKGFITGNFYAFSGDMQIPAIAVLAWAFMGVDTYSLAKRQRGRKPNL